MNNRVVQLALELMLVQSRYSSQEFRSLEKALSSGDYPFELREALQVVSSLRVSASKSENQMARSSRGIGAPRLPATKSAILAAVRKASLPRLREIADRLEIPSHQPNRSSLQRTIEEKISSLSDVAIEQLSLDPRRTVDEADRGYLGLAEFILKSPRREENSTD